MGVVMGEHRMLEGSRHFRKADLHDVHCFLCFLEMKKLQMDQTFKVFQNGPKKVARPASERSEPSRGERAWKEAWGGKMRAGGGS